MNDDDHLEIMNVRFALSVTPQHVQRAKTRMDSMVVNPAGLENGIDDVRMLCFNSEPTATSTKIGEMIEFNTLEDDIISSDTTGTEVSEFRQFGVPVGTKYFGFYGTAPGASGTHA